MEKNIFNNDIIYKMVLKIEIHLITQRSMMVTNKGKLSPQRAQRRITEHTCLQQAGRDNMKL
ncbi:MAG: hypothetical protein WC139_03900 [Candidatus Kapaibacterium sp.]